MTMRTGVHLTRSGLLGPGGQHTEPGQDFRGYSHNLEVGLWPYAGIPTVEVTHLWRQRRVARQELLRCPAAEKRWFVRNIDRDTWIAVEGGQ